MNFNLKRVLKQGEGSKTLPIYILLLLLTVLTMGILLYFFGPAIKEIQLPYFQNVKKYFLVIVVILIIFMQLKKKLA